MRNNSIEKTYQKKTLLEQILLRPDTYIGSTETYEQDFWILNNHKFLHQKIKYVPGLYKIFGNILY